MTQCSEDELASKAPSTCKLSDNLLECFDFRGQVKSTVTLGDVVCILPSQDEQVKEGYTLLYVQKNHEDEGPGLVHKTSLQSILLLSPPRNLLSKCLLANTPHHLDSLNNNRNIDIVISTLSGTCTALDFFNGVLRPLLAEIGVSRYETHITSSAQTITQLCLSKFIPCAKAGVAQTIVLLSGDGGLTDIVDSFHQSTESVLVSPDIALIPTGTGNAMASSLGLLSNSTTSLVTLLRGKPTGIPVFSAKFSPGTHHVSGEDCINNSLNRHLTEDKYPRAYGAVVASWGLHASLVADSDTAEYRAYGSDRFKMAAKELLYPSDGSESHIYRGTITTSKIDSQGQKGEEIMRQYDHMYVLVTLVPKLEKEFVISPSSIPLGGSLRIIQFGPVSPERAMDLMGLAYKGGGHIREREVFYSDIEGVRIDFQEANKRWRQVCIDGKVFVVEHGGWMEIHKEPRCLLNVFSPATD
ncbi:ATP-NAD kinase-like domain-containing protein [Aspergillus taichungensis]|uniref:ATP-NAD kinase-like domain-containing protein n=1 Tax=Aspergillus taichungensis TaxID=482145 RepID=A0A2J5HEY7_9EURO|nr:ATP-NAD kinase-like domain-containing protein [Aspergillus taichungensis]